MWERELALWRLQPVLSCPVCEEPAPCPKPCRPGEQGGRVAMGSGAMLKTASCVDSQGGDGQD